MYEWHEPNHLLLYAAIVKYLKHGDGVKYLLVHRDQGMMFQDRQGIYRDIMTYAPLDPQPSPDQPYRIWRAKNALFQYEGGFSGCGLAGYFDVRRSHRRTFFGEPDCRAPDSTARLTNGYIIGGVRMDDDGFAGLNARLRWPMAADDPILDHDISPHYLEFDQSRPPAQYNAVCPLDGYVTTLDAESHYRLSPGELTSKCGPDTLYRLCPQCLMILAQKVRIHRQQE